MRLRSLVVAALAAASTLAPIGAHAEDEYDCTIAPASAEHPHMSDPAGDYYSIVNNSSSPNPVNSAMGDIHGSGVDLRDAWVSSFTSPTGQVRYQINLQVGALNELAPGRWQQAGTRFTFGWTQDVGDPTRAERYVQAAISQSGAATFSHGYFTTDPATGLGSTNSAGSTTGTITAGTPGLISMVLPFHLPSVGKPTVISVPFTQSAFDTVAFYFFTDQGTDSGPCFEIKFA